MMKKATPKAYIGPYIYLFPFFQNFGASYVCIGEKLMSNYIPLHILIIQDRLIQYTI